MIVTSLSAFFGSVLPLALGQFQSVVPSVWLLCCPLFAGYSILNTLNVNTGFPARVKEWIETNAAAFYEGESVKPSSSVEAGGD